MAYGILVRTVSCFAKLLPIEFVAIINFIFSWFRNGNRISWMIVIGS